MKAVPSKSPDTYFWQCDNCDEWFMQESWDTNTYWWHAESERVHLNVSDDRYYFDEECGSEEFSSCPECGSMEVQSDLSSRNGKGMWRCSNCSHWHESKTAGDECCV